MGSVWKAQSLPALRENSGEGSWPKGSDPIILRGTMGPAGTSSTVLIRVWCTLDVWYLSAGMLVFDELNSVLQIGLPHWAHSSILIEASAHRCKTVVAAFCTICGARGKHPM